MGRHQEGTGIEMSDEFEMVKTDSGVYLGTGLQMPTADDTALMARLEVFRDDWIWTEDQIKNALLINGKQRYLADRDKRRYRVRNQSSLGKCNASSNTSAIEQIREQQGMNHEALADCHAYIHVAGGVDQGSTLPSTYKSMAEVGVSPYRLQVGGMTKMFPNDVYSRSQVEPAMMEQADFEAKRFMGVRLMKVPIGDFCKFKAVMATGLARGLGCIFAWHVGRNGMRIKNGYFQPDHGKTGNHSNLLHSGKWVGGDDLVHIDVMNSWGPVQDETYGPKGASWGEGGFALGTMADAFSCAHVHQPYFIISAGADEMDAALI